MVRKSMILFLFFAHGLLIAQSDFKISPELKNKKILMLFSSRSAAGPFVYKLNLYRHLYDAGYNVSAFIVRRNKVLEKKLEELHLPFIGMADKKYDFEGARNALHHHCLRENIDIIHGHTPSDVSMACWVAEKLPIRVVVTLHTELGHKKMHNVHGIITVSPQTASAIKERNKREQLNIKEIVWIAPFFDQEKFLQFDACYTDRKDFFQNEFDISIKDMPVLCMVGNFYRNKAWKNHSLLLRAIKKLIFEYNMPVNLMLAGTGPRMKKMKKFARNLGIAEYVYFLGFTSRVPELMHHSDIVLLTGSEEAFGIVLAEAALLKKPLIGTRGTGMESIVHHEQTGLLFEKNDVDDLVKQIQYLLKNPKHAQILGEQAFTHVLNSFSTSANLAKLDTFYKKVLL